MKTSPAKQPFIIHVGRRTATTEHATPQWQESKDNTQRREAEQKGKRGKYYTNLLVLLNCPRKC